MSASDLLFSFDGRINRAPWWVIELTIAVFGTVLPLIGAAVPESKGVVAFTMLLFGTPMIWVKFAIGTKRLHDRGKSGRWLVIFYVLPIILTAIADHAGGLSLFIGLPGAALMIWGVVELGFLRGAVDPNDYGPAPLQQSQIT